MNLTFVSPERLALFAAVAAFVVGYLVVQRRRAAYTVKFTNIELLDRVAPRRPRWRRHVPAVLFLVAASTLVVAFAEPRYERRIPKERATIILAIDASKSMEATDVDPSRVDAAKAAATSFIDLIPAKINIGVVQFNGNAIVKVAPTTDHAALKQGIATLELGERTAIGEAVATSLAAIASMPSDGQSDPAPARIVLLSDGKSTSGRSLEAAAEEANAASVPISTIAFGTDGGMLTLAEQPDTPVAVPVDRAALEQLATATNGTFSNAYTADELNGVYEDIGSSIGYTSEEADASAFFVGGALALLALTGLCSLRWFNRLP